MVRTRTVYPSICHPFGQGFSESGIMWFGFGGFVVGGLLERSSFLYCRDVIIGRFVVSFRVVVYSVYLF